MPAVPAGHVGKAGLTSRKSHGRPGDCHFAEVERVAKPAHSPADQDKARLWWAEQGVGRLLKPLPGGGDL